MFHVSVVACLCSFNDIALLHLFNKIGWPIITLLHLQLCILCVITARQYRTRECLHGRVGQAGCELDDAVSTRPCATQQCERWSEWTVTSECSVSCGRGTMVRHSTRINGIVEGRMLFVASLDKMLHDNYLLGGI